jgi:site-specific DNA-methyltransferase (adenine-specific)
MKSKKNRTIDLTEQEGEAYLSRCIHLRKAASLEEVQDQIIIGDAFKVLQKLPNQSVDLLIVDPPYNLTKDFHGNAFHRQKQEDYRAFTEQWILAVKPLLKENASVYVCCDWESGMIIGPLLQQHFILRNRITWQREKGRGAKANWKNGMEDIWFATCSKDYRFHLNAVKQRRRVLAPYKQDGQPKDWQQTDLGKFRDTCPSNFWDDLSVPYWSMAENTAHPTQKPEKLAAKLILASSDRGGVVLDPFCGSGTIPVTAKKLGRHFIGIEQNRRYCVWTQKRLEMAEADSSIQGYENGVFWERNSKPFRKK